jgi:hypothetical protein
MAIHPDFSQYDTACLEQPIFRDNAEGLKADLINAPDSHPIISCLCNSPDDCDSNVIVVLPVMIVHFVKFS